MKIAAFGAGALALLLAGSAHAHHKSRMFAAPRPVAAKSAAKDAPRRQGPPPSRAEIKRPSPVPGDKNSVTGGPLRNGRPGPGPTTVNRADGAGLRSRPGAGGLAHGGPAG